VNRLRTVTSQRTFISTFKKASYIRYLLDGGDDIKGNQDLQINKFHKFVPVMYASTHGPSASASTSTWPSSTSTSTWPSYEYDRVRVLGRQVRVRVRVRVLDRQVRIRVRVLGRHTTEYEYLKLVLEYYSSNSTSPSTKYYNPAYIGNRRIYLLPAGTANLRL